MPAFNEVKTLWQTDFLKRNEVTYTMPVDTIPARFMEQGRIRPDSPAYYVRQSGSWRPTTWRDYVAEVRMATRALISLGVGSGQTVCILGFNRPEWVIMDIANMAVGGAPAGIYTTCSAEEVQYILHHAEAPVVLLEDEGQWEKVKAERANLPNLKHVVMMKGAPDIDDDLVMSWDDFMARAEDTKDEEVDLHIAKLEEEQTATLIYTSGTTGPPKGVMLTHKNLAWTSQIAQGLVSLRAHDCSLSYLPLSHIAEQMFSIHGPITAGASVYFAESIEAVPDNVKEVQPTVFFGVPRIWEKFYAGVTGKLKDATGTKAKLVTWAQGVATRVNTERNAGRTPTGVLALQYALAQKVIFPSSNLRWDWVELEFVSVVPRPLLKRFWNSLLASTSLCTRFTASLKVPDPPASTSRGVPVTEPWDLYFRERK